MDGSLTRRFRCRCHLLSVDVNRATELPGALEAAAVACSLKARQQLLDQTSELGDRSPRFHGGVSPCEIDTGPRLTRLVAGGDCDPQGLFEREAATRRV